MTNKSKDKGTWFEGQVVAEFHAHDVNAKREVLHGNKDHGDLHVTLPGGKLLVVECKWRPTLPSAAQILKWLDEADQEGLNARADASCLVINRPGSGAKNRGDHLAFMFADEWAWLTDGVGHAPTRDWVCVNLAHLARRCVS